MRYGRTEDLVRLAFAFQGSREGLSFADIQRDLGVSRRTAERLRDAAARLFPTLEEVPTGERTKRWRIPTAATSGLVAFSVEELAELHGAREALARAGLKDRVKYLDGMIAKVKAMMPRAGLIRLEPDLAALLEAEGLAMRPGPAPLIRPGVLEVLRGALKACRVVSVRYRARGTGRLSTQRVHPHGVLYGSRHFLVAFSPWARDYRLLSLPNIEGVRLEDEHFERQLDFDIRAYAARSFGVFQEEPVEVLLCFSRNAAADARTFRFHPTQVITPQRDGRLLVSFRAGGLLEMCWHLFTWGNEVEIVKPTALGSAYRGMVRDVARRLDLIPTGRGATRSQGRSSRKPS